MRESMKLWLVAGRGTDSFGLFSAKPEWNGDAYDECPLFGLDESGLRSTGFSRKLPVGKQMLVVRLSLK